MSLARVLLRYTSDNVVVTASRMVLLMAVVQLVSYEIDIGLS